MTNTKNKLTKGVEIATNLSIILVALIGATVLVKNYLLRPPVTITTGRPPAAAPGRDSGEKRELPSGPAQGTQLSVPGITWSDSEETVVLALSDTCKYCTESAPFYKRLAEETAKRTGVKVVAVFPQETSAGKKYLDDLGVTVGDVKQATLASFGVRGTPTLVIVDKTGTVKQSWVGKLNPERETEVLSRVKS
jgi:thiol-disulfide isomerase/thioredoxin